MSVENAQLCFILADNKTVFSREGECSIKNKQSIALYVHALLAILNDLIQIILKELFKEYYCSLLV